MVYYKKILLNHEIELKIIIFCLRKLKMIIDSHCHLIMNQCPAQLTDETILRAKNHVKYF